MYIHNVYTLSCVCIYIVCVCIAIHTHVYMPVCMYIHLCVHVTNYTCANVERQSTASKLASEHVARVSRRLFV